MRLTSAAGIAMLLLVPAADACSLAYQPWEKASFHDDGLWYVDGSSLRHVDGLVETAVAEAFFLSYARLPGDRLLVAGQDGLGADCSGDPWLELRDAGAVAWREETAARVFAHPLGPFVQMDRALLRLDGDELVAAGTLAKDAYIVGWTTDGKPVTRDGGGLAFDGRSLPIPSGDEPEVAAHDGRLGALEALWDNRAEAFTAATLHVVADDAVTNVTWGVAGGWGDGLAWAGGWLAAAGGRAYLVTEEVTDLGVADARNVAARGGQGVVFTDAGYVVFDGTQAVQAWERDPQTRLWRPAAIDTEPPRRVEHETTGPGRLLSDPTGSRTATTGDGGTFTVPGAAPMLLALAALALAAVRRR